MDARDICLADCPGAVEVSGAEYFGDAGRGPEDSVPPTDGSSRSFFQAQVPIVSWSGADSCCGALAAEEGLHPTTSRHFERAVEDALLPWMPKLLDCDALERSPIVANRRMNRERGLAGGNSYAKDLGLNPLDWLLARLNASRAVAWLDLCCGSGKAVVEAALRVRALGLMDRVSMVGVDLVDHFVQAPAELEFLRLEEASVRRWNPGQRFDLITCVHGLHYVGDKLGVVVRAAGWLAPGGLLCANFDAASIKVEGRSKAQVVRALQGAGLKYDPRRRLLRLDGAATVTLPFVYLGADDSVGPNYTGQAAVDSHYRAQ